MNKKYTVLLLSAFVFFSCDKDVGEKRSPVVLNCGFFDPLGETIAISDTVH
jgi:hypothetical protein